MRKIEKNSVQRIAAAIVNFNFPLPYSLHNYEQHCFVVLKPLQWILMKRVVLSFVSLFFSLCLCSGNSRWREMSQPQFLLAIHFKELQSTLRLTLAGKRKLFFFFFSPSPPFFSSPQHEVKVDFNFRFKGEITVLVSSIPFFFFLPPSTL